MRKRQNKYNIVKSNPSTQEICDVSDLERMNTQIKKLSPQDGLLHFVITTNKEGWIAQCEELSGIITGGRNSKPTQDEIHSTIKNAVYSAFDVHCY